MKRNIEKYQYLILIIVIIIFFYGLTQMNIFKNIFSEPETIKTFILQFGILAPLAVILLQIFQTIISIIPSQITTIIAGYLFGPVLGLIYSLTGAFIGSLITFTISRKYGKKLALHLFERRDIVHFHLLFKKKKLWALFLARIAPLFPNDLVSFAAGMTKIRFSYFNIVSTLGFLVQMTILTYFGSELSSGTVSPSLIAITVLVSLLFIVVLFKHRIKKVIVKDFKELEREGKIFEKLLRLF